MARVGVGERERRARRARIAPDLRRCAAEAAAIPEPAELEAYGFRMLATPALARAPRELLEDAVAEIAAAPRGGPLLQAIAAAAAPPASSLAAAAVRNRGAGGPGSSAAAGVGSLALVRAWAVADGPDVGVVFACRRPGDPRAQVLGFTLGRLAGTVLLLDGVVTPPLDDPALLAPAESAAARGRSGVEEIVPERAVARVEQAARGTLAVGRPPTLGAAQALLLLLRARRSAGAERVLAELHRLAVLGAVAAEP
ncbi:MAG: hypothetical protein QOK40_1757, partial [Miltoncostaeaceae bacterium]|nr:hypothetical protein [Miltoncostaeaceae bacterium]